MALDWSTTWIGLLGGGCSGSVFYGGSIYQFDVWNMGQERVPVRVMVKGTRVGAMAEIGSAVAVLIVTGCRTAKDMDGITSSGIDWEASAILKGSALVKSGSSLLKILSAKAAAKVVDWAVQEPAKRFVQWYFGQLGIVQSGRQFNLLPTPMAVGIGWGLFYDWQTLKLLGGKIGWQYISPKWRIETYQGNIRLQLFDIPEQDGTPVPIGLSVPEWGQDPYLRWKSKTADVQIGYKSDYHIVGYAYGGCIFERSDGMGYSGINLANLQPIGRLEHHGLSMPSRTKTVQKGGKLVVRPEVLWFGNMPYWEADDTVEMTLDSNGCFVSASGGSKLRN